jgi:hypothetical protein
LLQHPLGNPVVALGDGADGGDKVGFHLLVGKEALDAEEEQAADVVVGEGVVEDKCFGLGETDTEEAEEAVEGHGEGALVDDEGADGGRPGEGVLEEAVAGDELDLGVALEEKLEVALGERVVLDHTDGELGRVAGGLRHGLREFVPEAAESQAGVEAEALRVRASRGPALRSLRPDCVGLRVFDRVAARAGREGRGVKLKPRMGEEGGKGFQISNLRSQRG